VLRACSHLGALVQLREDNSDFMVAAYESARYHFGSDSSFELTPSEFESTKLAN
jgi:hypothetical protein